MYEEKYGFHECPENDIKLQQKQYFIESEYHIYVIWPKRRLEVHFYVPSKNVFSDIYLILIFVGT